MNPAVLRFLAGESCDFTVVRALRTAGYDVYAVSEVMQRSDDLVLVEQAHREQRILLTEEDFGQLVFASHIDTTGVILIRFPGKTRQTLAQAITRVVQEQDEQLFSAFVVLQPGYTRISRTPRI
jgi:predicted nuclease of predicted toxin-antitoxin system